MTSFAEIYSRPDIVRQFDFAQLEAPEKALLHAVMRQPRAPDLLDLGIGAGRTTRFLAPLCGSYTGLDIAPGMIAHCARVYADQSQWKLVEGDAADLSRWAEATFDFVLFSFNGLDCLDRSGRTACLAEMWRVLRPGGTLLFSSHNLQSIPVTYHADNPELTPIRLAGIDARNPSPAERAEAVDLNFWDGVYGDDVDLRRLYVRPAAQVATLAGLGFARIEVLIPGTGEVAVPARWDHLTEFSLYYRAIKPLNPAATESASDPT